MILQILFTKIEKYQSKSQSSASTAESTSNVSFILSVTVPCWYISALTAPTSNLSKTSKISCILDKLKVLVITEKWCYIACINIQYGNPSLDLSRPYLSQLDCLAASRHLSCKCLKIRQQNWIPSPLEMYPFSQTWMSIALGMLDQSRLTWKSTKGAKCWK